MAYRYKTVKIDGKTKLLHRHVMEQHLGRQLQRDEHVHHRNGDPYDNRIENLEVLSVKQHMHHHKQKHPTESVCVICGADFTPHPTKRGRKKTCGRQCGYKLRWITRRGVCPPLAQAIVRAQFDDSAEYERDLFTQAVA